MLPIEPIETAPALNLTPHDLDTLIDELRAYHAIYSPLFQRREQREWSERYRHGLLLELPRKSIEPMVLALEGPHRNTVRAMQQFLSEGAWDDEAILRRHWPESIASWGRRRGADPGWERLSQTRHRIGGGETPVLRRTGQASQRPGRSIPGVCQPARLYVAGSPAVSAAGMA